jgi:lipid-A-disaccharide synthase
MRKWVDTVLTALPFEDDWYRQRGVRTNYVGHPYFDELGRQTIDEAFVRDQRARGGPVVALLPGSRGQEVTGNFPLMVAAAKRVHAARPDVRFLVASFNDKQAVVARQMLAGSGIPADVHVGRTPEVIELADAAMAVSGSVGLELMYRLTPTVVVYKLKPFELLVARQFITARFISLVNLLAGEELFPEYLTTRDDSVAMAGDVLAWLNDPAARAAAADRLRALRDRVAVPGACGRAAAAIAGGQTVRRAA